LHRGYLHGGRLYIEGVTMDRVPNPVAHLDLFLRTRTVSRQGFMWWLQSYCNFYYDIVSSSQWSRTDNIVVLDEKCKICSCTCYVVTLYKP